MAEKKEKNIYQRMAAISAEMSKVAKDLEIGYGNNKYKAVAEGDVLDAVKPLEEKHGIYSYPESRRVIESQVMTAKDYKGNEKQSQFIRLEVNYTFVNVDNPQERVTITSYGDGVDPQDKAPGKAMTYADKYALLKAYKIITGEDTDQYESASGKFSQKPEQVKQNEEPKPAKANAKEPKTEDGWKDVDEMPCSEESKAYIKQMCEAMGLDVGKVCEKVGVKMIVATNSDGNKTKTFRNADFIKMKNHLEERYAEIEGAVG